MAHAVEAALRDGRHLVVQAGTGTGKSLAYLVPALLHDSRVIVATATLNLQHQLVERDIPTLMSSMTFENEEPKKKSPGKEGPGTDTSYAVLKGRANYACLHRVREGTPDDQETLVDVPGSGLGADVVRLRQWAEEQAKTNGSGDREFAPSHRQAAWRQVSVSARECLGAQKCPYAAECFAEKARAAAEDAHLVVTNHALLAIDAIGGVPTLPEYDAVVIDEAHELTSRVTQASTTELGPEGVERAGRRARHCVDGDEAADLIDSADDLAEALGRLEPGRIHSTDEQLVTALEAVRDRARSCLTAVAQNDGRADAARQQAQALLDEVYATAQRIAGHDAGEVVWMSDNRGDRSLHIAPIDVSEALRERLFASKTVVLTSATLKLGGSFEAIAGSVGLSQDWDGVDVGSPFDYRRQAILYVATHLPKPGRDGLGNEQLDEIKALVESAGGRTLGLFSSRRAAETAAAHIREHTSTQMWCQGDAPLSQLAQKFIADPHTCLFGTLSLWQGIDIPGDACQLVIIDRIPFPRPDDPIMSARSQYASKHGGNGFMDVSATHAALLLAQGTGRLIRNGDDRGVVAVLDPRLVTARYGNFLTASLPPMWRTTDRAVTTQALTRLNAATDLTR